MKKREKIGRLRVWVFLALILCTPVMAQAWSGDEILSHFQVYLWVTEEYDSNIDLTPNRVKRDDFITTITPGFKFSFTPKSPITGEFRQTPTAEENYGFDLDFNAGFNFYAKNHDENYISLNGNLNAWYALTKNLSFRVRDYLVRSNDTKESDYSPTAIPGTYLPSKSLKSVPWIRNVVEPSVEYKFGRENLVALNYRNNVYNTDSRISEDSMENYVNPKFNYWFDIRNGVSFEYGLMLGTFDRSPDLVGNMARGRYTYRLAPKTSIFGDYTQLWRNFDSPSIDYVVYNPSIGIEHAFSPTLSARAQVGYYRADPSKGSVVDGPTYDVLLTQRGQRTTYTLSFQGGYQEDFFTSDNRGFTQYHRAIGRVNYQLLKNMNVGFFTGFVWQKFIQSGLRRKEIDQIWDIGGNASYQLFRWLTFSLDFTHAENHSNIDGSSYSDYRGFLRVTARY